MVLLLCLGQSSMGQNLLDLSGWTIGEGSVTGFNQNGSTSENTREWGIGPHGNRVILWKASPDAVSGPDGGWVTSAVSVDHTKMYRLSIWIKKTNSMNGTTYFGCYTGPDPVLSLTGSANSNPYFRPSDPPSLDKWYLWVGFVHGSGDNSTTNYGAVYDGETGEKIWYNSDFKFQTTATALSHRAYLFYDTDLNDRQYFYAPRIDEVNGNEPTITELLGLVPNQLNQLSVGTDNLPSGYKLSVGGDAIMEKVKVQLEGSWPDYVFSKEYPLLDLGELQSYVNKNGHLPGVPSAQEIKESNQDLGLIQQKLLEKIEELTLYTIQQENAIKSRDMEIDQLKNDLVEIRKQNLEILELLKKIKDN